MHKCFILFFIFICIKHFLGINLFKYADSPYATTEGNLNLECPQFGTQLFKHSMFTLGPHLWNFLTATIKNVSNVNYFQ